MRRSAGIAVLLALAPVLFTACSGEPRTSAGDSAGATGAAVPDTTSAAGATGAGAPSGQGTAADTAPREIYIDEVVPGNPLVVRGRARTFENTVQIRASDAGGATITEVYETSVGEMGHHNPYTARVWLVRDPGAFVTIGAFEYSARDGSVRSLVTRRVPVDGPRTRVTVMFPTSECTTTRAFERDVPRAVGIAQLLAHMLVAGPTEAERTAGAAAVFPMGSRVNGVVLRDGVLTVDFNERLQNVGGACAAQGIRAAVTATMTRLPGVRRVVITAGGSESLALQP